MLRRSVPVIVAESATTLLLFADDTSLQHFFWQKHDLGLVHLPRLQCSLLSKFSEKAVDSGGDPASLVVRGRCHLLLGHLQEALEDAKAALAQDPSIVKGE